MNNSNGMHRLLNPCYLPMSSNKTNFPRFYFHFARKIMEFDRARGRFCSVSNLRLSVKTSTFFACWCFMLVLRVLRWLHSSVYRRRLTQVLWVSADAY